VEVPAVPARVRLRYQQEPDFAERLAEPPLERGDVLDELLVRIRRLLVGEGPQIAAPVGPNLASDFPLRPLRGVLLDQQRITALALEVQAPGQPGGFLQVEQRPLAGLGVQRKPPSVQVTVK